MIPPRPPLTARLLHGLRLPALALGAAALLGACAVSRQVPDWSLNAVGHTERFAAAYLKGDDRVAAREFSLARAEVARTGRPDLVARLELNRCATHAASLDFSPCEGFAAVQQDAGEPELAYARYLQGQASAADAALLPAAHRSVVTAADPAAGAAAVAAIKEPLSRLVAAATLLRAGHIDLPTVTQAVDTASQQGWRRPLLAWLGVQERLSREQGQTEEAQRIQRRMNLLAPAARPAAAPASAPASSPAAQD